MEEYKEKWEGCLEMIRQKLNDERVFGTWFAGIAFESYDARTNSIMLRLPSKYVYEYLEQYGVRFMSWALGTGFGPGIRLQYRVMNEPSFADVAAWLRQYGYDASRDPYHVSIANARKRMEDGLHYFLDGSEQWLPGYDKIADWLTDNKGRGLLVIGTPGLGKTLVCQKILPVILGNGARPIVSVNAADIRGRLDELKRERIVIIDDLGKEPRLHFGEPDNSFFELCNNAERNGNLLVITTNLSTTPVRDPRYPESIQGRYGVEVLDRLRAVTSLAIITGDSLRH